MVTGRAMASLIVPGRGKGSSREETKVQSWIGVWGQIVPPTHKHTDSLSFPAPSLLPASQVTQSFPIFQGLQACLREGYE